MRRVLLLSSLIVLSMSFGACAKTGSHNLNCDTAEVSPSSQPGLESPKKALDWYLGNLAKTARLPPTGYRLESHTKTRYVYVSGDTRISIGALPSTDAKAPKIWVVLMTYSC